MEQWSGLDGSDRVGIGEVEKEDYGLKRVVEALPGFRIG